MLKSEFLISTVEIQMYQYPLFAVFHYNSGILESLLFLLVNQIHHVLNYLIPKQEIKLNTLH